MEEVIGIARISRKTQNLQRQINSLRAKYPNCRIIKITCSGAKVIGYREFEKVIDEVKQNKNGKKYKLVFESASRMSRDSEGGCALYEDLFNHDVCIEFLKEPQINTEVYKKALNNKIQVQVKTGNKATDELINKVIEALNEFTIELAKEQIKKIFDEAESELNHIHYRTSSGIAVAKAEGKRIGTPKGTKLITKKSKQAKEIILKHSKDFNGNLTDVELIKLTGVAPNTYYSYKKQLKEVY